MFGGMQGLGFMARRGLAFWVFSLIGLMVQGSASACGWLGLIVCGC